jgi:hypothetical protein
MDGLDSIRLAPNHLKDLQIRFQDTLILKEHIHLATDTFQKYAQAGTKLCETLGNLAQSFQQFKEFQNDQSFQRVSAVLFRLQDSFSTHYQSIQTTVIQPLLSFLAGDIKDAETCSKKSLRDYNQYISVLDQFVQPKRKPQDGDQIGKLQKVYWDAVRSDFEFQRALEHVEVKRLPVVALHFVNFKSRIRSIPPSS